jgi:hypothetical protein
MKRSQRKGNISPRWEWLRSWCSEVGEVWLSRFRSLGQHPVTYSKEWWAWVDLNHRPRPYQLSTGPIARIGEEL